MQSLELGKIILFFRYIAFQSKISVRLIKILVFVIRKTNLEVTVLLLLVRNILINSFVNSRRHQSNIVTNIFKLTIST